MGKSKFIYLVLLMIFSSCESQVSKTSTIFNTITCDFTFQAPEKLAVSGSELSEFVSDGAQILDVLEGDTYLIEYCLPQVDNSDDDGSHNAIDEHTDNSEVDIDNSER